MASQTIGALSVKIDADTRGATKGISGVGKSLDTLGAKARTAANAMGKWALGIGTAAAAAATAIVNSNLKSIDSLAKTADQLGVTTESLQGLRHAAELTGVSADQMDAALVRVQKAGSDAAKGLSTSAKAVEDLGLNIEEFNALDPEGKMLAVARGMEGITNQGDRTRIAMDLFGRSGAALVNTLAQGEQGLREMTGEVDALGASISRVDAAKIEQANDAFTRGQMAVSTFGKQLTISVAPALTAIVEKLTMAGNETANFGDVAQSVFSGAIKFAGFVADAFKGIQFVIKSLEVPLRAFNFAMAGLYRDIAGGVDTLIDTVKKGINTVIVDLQRFGIEIETLSVGAPSAITSHFSQMADQAKEDLNQATTELSELFTSMAVMPSQELERFVSHAEQLAQLRAEQMVLQQEAEQAHQDVLTDIEDKGAQDRVEISEKEAEMKRLAKLAEIDAMQTGAAAGIQLLSNFGKKSFALQKTFAIAESAVNIAGGVAKALNNPYPANLAFAAQVAAQGAGLISTIKSSKPGSTSSTPFASRGAGGGGVSTAPAAPQPQQNRTVAINLVGNTFNADQVRELIGQINEQIGDGAELNTGVA